MNEKWFLWYKEWKGFERYFVTGKNKRMDYSNTVLTNSNCHRIMKLIKTKSSYTKKALKGFYGKKLFKKNLILKKYCEQKKKMVIFVTFNKFFTGIWQYWSH